MFQPSSNSVRRSPVWLAALIGSVVTAQGLLGLAARPVTTAQLSDSRSIQVETPDQDTRFTAAVVLAALGIGIIGYSWTQSRKSSGSHVSSVDRQLLLLMHQDRAAAERLVDQMQRKHPEKSRQWCVEKVKYDLARDRH